MAALRRLAFFSRVLGPGKSWSQCVLSLRRSAFTKMATSTEILQATFTESESGTMIAEKKCKKFCHFYSLLVHDDKISFLRTLCHDYGVNQDNVINVARHVVTSQEKGDATLLQAEERLRNALTPRYKQLFSQIGRIEGGVKFLVDLRADILNYLSGGSVDQESSFFRSLNITLQELLALWFSVGFLNLQRITWRSSCDMVQKISEYEAVHPIRNWTDLKRRVGPYRRCFVFTHNSMPQEPVVVLHTALSQEISNSIHSIVSHSRGLVTADTDDSRPPSSIDSDSDLEDPSMITTAVFYSITSTQRGLQGVDLGNYLIKRVVKELQAEFPKMYQFSSLSPIPGFKDWLITEINKYLHLTGIGEFPENTLFTKSELSSIEPHVNSADCMRAVKSTLQKADWVNNEQLSLQLKSPLLRLCARYLYSEKRRGMAINPVANFHLGNGAVMWRLNWLADKTPRGVGQSCGIMVNYRYFLDHTEENSQSYLEDRHIAASKEFLQLCDELTDTPFSP